MTSLHAAAIPLSPTALPVTVQKRFTKCIHRWNFYRLAKHVGHGRWWRYRERFIPPASVETRKGLYFNTQPTRTQTNEALSWQWKFGQGMARATSSAELLDVWAYYRRMRKRPGHFLFCLRRLTRLGGCSLGDWRYRELRRKLDVLRPHFTRWAHVLLYLSLLGDRAAVERFLPLLMHRVALFSPRELGMALEACARVSLQDRDLFGRVSSYLVSQLESRMITADLLVSVAKSHARLQIRNEEFFLPLAREVMRRGQLGAYVPAYNARVRASNADLARRVAAQQHAGFDPRAAGHRPAVDPGVAPRPLVIPDTRYFPTVRHLAEFAAALADLNLRHYTFFEYLALQLAHLMHARKPLPPFVFATAALAFLRAAIRDEGVLAAARRQLAAPDGSGFRPDEEAALIRGLLAVGPARELYPAARRLFARNFQGLTIKGAMHAVIVAQRLKIPLATNRPVKETVQSHFTALCGRGSLTGAMEVPAAHFLAACLATGIADDAEFVESTFGKVLARQLPTLTPDEAADTLRVAKQTAQQSRGLRRVCASATAAVCDRLLELGDNVQPEIARQILHLLADYPLAPGELLRQLRSRAGGRRATAAAPDSAGAEVATLA